jgi:hypothetical protein
VLKIDYPNDGSALTEAKYSITEGQVKREVTRRYVRARVRNVGKRTAQNCRVFLTGVEEVQTGGRPTETAFHDSMVIAWPLDDFEPRAIPAGVAMYVDVVNVFKDALAGTLG